MNDFEQNNEAEEIDPSRVREIVTGFFSHLSRVNDESGQFIVESSHWWGQQYLSDACQQEEHVLRWAEKLTDLLASPDDPRITDALEAYKDSISELRAVRSYKEHILRGEVPLGAEINERHPITNEIRERLQMQQGFETQASLKDFAAAFEIDKENAAHLKAFLKFNKAELVQAEQTHIPQKNQTII
jgi:hypothetical protein